LDPGLVKYQDHVSESLETTFWVKILKSFDADPGYGMEKIEFGSGIRDGKNWDPVSGINTRIRNTGYQ
jgi:hypothetical protein